MDNMFSLRVSSENNKMQRRLRQQKDFIEKSEIQVLLQIKSQKEELLKDIQSIQAITPPVPPKFPGTANSTVGPTVSGSEGSIKSVSDSRLNKMEYRSHSNYSPILRQLCSRERRKLMPESEPNKVEFSSLGDKSSGLVPSDGESKRIISNLNIDRDKTVSTHILLLRKEEDRLDDQEGTKNSSKTSGCIPTMGIFLDRNTLSKLDRVDEKHREQLQKIRNAKKEKQRMELPPKTRTRIEIAAGISKALEQLYTTRQQCDLQSSEECTDSSAGLSELGKTVAKKSSSTAYNKQYKSIPVASRRPEVRLGANEMHRIESIRRKANIGPEVSHSFSRPRRRSITAKKTIAKD